jgi:hypothetical protein
MPSGTRLWGGVRVMSTSANVTDPAVGVTCPAMLLRSVDFPAPFAPMMASVSPSSMVTVSP